VGVSVLTLASGRRLHLQRLIEGLCRSEVAPDELIIVDMGGPAIKIPHDLVPHQSSGLAGYSSSAG
jgi:hypothetical protein